MKIKLHFLILSFLVVTLLCAVGLFRLRIDPDIMNSLPTGDRVIKDAMDILLRHPGQDMVLVDISLERPDKDLLLRCGLKVKSRLEKSGLFKSVGMEDFMGIMPKMVSHILHNIPLLFSKQDLADRVAPLLVPDLIRARLRSGYSRLLGIGGIGQSSLFSADPLCFRNIVLERLSMLAPSKGIQVVKGCLISPDSLHLLITAKPLGMGMDTAFARKLDSIMDGLPKDLKPICKDNRVSIIHMGAYRAAIDNEDIVRADVRKALFLATAGIALLLIAVFSRPLLGLLALLPAFMGVMMAIFVYSLFFRSISLMVLGFGGAIISISVDHGISYMLFMDRPCTTFGRDASREIRAIGLIAVLTTVGAFLTLSLCGLPMFVQLGLFTSLGLLFSFIFVHTVFPSLFESISSAAPWDTGHLSLFIRKRIIANLTRAGWSGACAVLLMAVVMAFFVNPGIDSSLEAMNTVSPDTLRAEKLFRDVWGMGAGKVFLMAEAKSLNDLLDKGDHLLVSLKKDTSLGIIKSAYVPSELFPGPTLQKRNFIAWRQFWTRERIDRLKSVIQGVSEELGFSAHAFTPFFESITSKIPPTPEREIPQDLLNFARVSKSADTGTWVCLSEVTPGMKYSGKTFYDKYSPQWKIFDPGFFSNHLGNLLFSTFMNLFVTVLIALVVMIFLFFLDIRLTFITICPVMFALVATLGILDIMGHPIDIPVMMLSVVTLGMGVDYSLFLVRAYQRYRDMSHPFFGIIVTSVFMSGTSTMIGFGVLCFSRHSLLRSAGLTSLFGIGFSLAGAFLVLPPVLKYFFEHDKDKPYHSPSIKARVLYRYRRFEAYPRMFARFKLLLDPMFKELKDILGPISKLHRVVDIGTGFGLPACFIAEAYEDAMINGIDPDPERVRVARLAIGDRGHIEIGQAPHDIPVLESPADMVMMLDMIHYLDDSALLKSFVKVRSILHTGGMLVIRTTFPRSDRFSFMKLAEDIHLYMAGARAYYRSLEETIVFLNRSGFTFLGESSSGTGGELRWILARK